MRFPRTNKIFRGQLEAAPFAGVFADRHNRHFLCVLIQAASMAQALVLTVLVMTHTITVWEIIVLSLLLGVINAFDIPVRQSYINEMIDDREDLGNAIAITQIDKCERTKIPTLRAPPH